VTGQDSSAVHDVATGDPFRRARPSLRATAGGVEYEIALCQDAQELYALGPMWNELLSNARHKSAFLKHQWMSTWWRLIGSASRSRQLFILTARDAGHGLVGILPLYRETHGYGPFRYRVLRFVGTTHEAPEHLDAIVHDTNHAQVIRALIAGLSSYRSEYDALLLTDLAEDALLIPALAQWSESNRFPYRSWTWKVCPYLTTVGSFESYLKTVSSKHRYKVRHFGRRLAQSHQMEFEVAREPLQVKRAIEEFFELHAMRWLSNEDDVSGFDNELSRAFHRSLAENLAKEDGIRLFLLRCDGRAVAACYCFRFDRRLFFYQPGWDPAFRQLHVGKVLLGRVLQYCFEESIREFDFLRGTEDYKFDWTSETRRTMAWQAGLSLPAKIAFALAHAHQQTRQGVVAVRKRIVSPLKRSDVGMQLITAVKKGMRSRKPGPSKRPSSDVSAAAGSAVERELDETKGDARPPG
jgi:CelD/BcsL family acetyltransferase involved in cellulose biosynthesis